MCPHCTCKHAIHAYVTQHQPSPHRVARSPLWLGEGDLLGRIHEHFSVHHSDQFIGSFATIEKQMNSNYKLFRWVILAWLVQGLTGALLFWIKRDSLYLGADGSALSMLTLFKTTLPHLMAQGIWVLTLTHLLPFCSLPLNLTRRLTHGLWLATLTNVLWPHLYSFSTTIFVPLKVLTFISFQGLYICTILILFLRLPSTREKV